MAESIRNLEWREAKFTAGGLEVLPDRPGVYMICARPPEAPVSFRKLALKNPMYIGKAEDLSVRIKQHFGRPDENIMELRKHFSTELFLWYAVADIASIEDIEDKMIFCFWPAANRRIKMMGELSITGFNGVLSGRGVVQSSISANYRRKGGKQ